MNKIQHKLVLQILLTSTLPLILLAAITVSFLGQMAISETQQRLNGGLNVGLTVYEEVSTNLKFIVRDQNRRIYTLMNENQLDLLRNEYVKIVRENKLDFFFITDNFGNVLVSISAPDLEGRNIATIPWVRRALLKGQFTVSTEILNAEESKAFGFLERSKISGIDETRSMIIQATFPVINNNEIIVGTMSAGYLLNNNNSIIVDPIKKNTGFISSVFMDETRICSSVILDGNAYAIGSKIDPQKAAIILGQGQKYLGRIQIIKDWYLSGYAPLYNGQKEIVGILGVALPEATVYKLRNHLTLIFIIAVVISILLALFIGFWMGERIVLSIRKLMAGIEAVIKGDYGHRIEIHSHDEIEEVGNFFNKMTQQLITAQRQLVETHKQLVQYEKMAAIGRMAAVLSHELRNVFAGIEVSIYYLKAKMGGDFPETLNKILEVEKEINYARNLLANISTFVTTRKISPRQTVINEIMEETLNAPLLQEIMKNNNITLEKQLDASIPPIMADGTQIKEVLSNLCINAAQAMPNGGRLTVSTYKDGTMMGIRVEDTGAGISQETLKDLFTPFFTTKSKGLGLGLFIAKEIVELHNGRIELKTEVNKGSRFDILLPL